MQGKILVSRLSYFFRTTKMLLMLPIEIIDGVAVIKEYLESGTYSNKNKWKQNLEEISTRNKAGIDASADAIFFTNATGIIEYFNPGSTT